MNVLEAFATSFDGGNWRTDPYEMLLWSIRSDRDALLPLARWLVTNVEEPRNLVSDLVCHLTEAEFAQLVALVAPTLILFEPLANARECIEAAASQVPESLSSYLSFVRKRKSLYRVEYAWRAAAPQERMSLEKLITSSDDGGAVLESWDRLLESRDVETIHRVFRSFDTEDQISLARYALDRDLVVSDQGVATLTLGPCHHLFFAGGLPVTETGYLESIRRLHPTAHLRSEHDVTGLSGGTGAGRCGVCREAVSVLLRLRGAPAGFSFGAGPLALVACISCLSVDPSPLYYSHENPAEPVNLAVPAERQAADFVFPPCPSAACAPLRRRSDGAFKMV